MINWFKGLYRSWVGNKYYIDGTPKNFYRHMLEGYKPSNDYVLKNGIKWGAFKVIGNTIFAHYTYIPSKKNEVAVVPKKEIKKVDEEEIVDDGRKRSRN